MRVTYSALMQSKYFNPAFNSAVFDGPLRIYFAQFHESLALKIYFSFQQKFPNLWEQAKETHKRTGQVLLVMLYPTADSYRMSFEDGQAFISAEKIEEDDIIGIRGAFEDEQMDTVLTKINLCFGSWNHLKQKTQMADLSL